MEQQLSLLEDELSEARLEGSRLKTELISNKSAFEVKVSEMASRINEVNSCEDYHENLSKEFLMLHLVMAILGLVGERWFYAKIKLHE